MTDGSGSKGEGRLARCMPVLTWLPRYERDWFRHDLFAALTVAAFAVPNMMAFSQLAGLPPQYGLYAGVGAGIGYFLFGTVKRLSVGPTAAQSIMMAGVLSAMVVRGDFGTDQEYWDRYITLAILTSLMVGTIFIVARVFRLGFIVNLVPVPVFTGFMAGMGLTIIMSQLPKVFGVPGTEGDFFTRLFDLIGHMGDINLPTLGLGALLLAILFLLDRHFKRLPNPLIVLVVSILIMTFTDLSDLGVETVGDIPSGIPRPTIHDLDPGDVELLLPLALGLFLLSFVESASIGKKLESKHNYRMDPDQELLALGAANIGSGLLQGFPVSASVSRSFLNDLAGARTQLSSLLMALVLLVVAIWLTGLLYNMPMVVLGVLIIVAVYRVIDLPGLDRIRSISRTAFLVAMASFGSVLVFGILEGILIGVGISFVYILFRIASPSMAVLGRIPGTPDFKDVARNDEYVLYPGVLILRFNAPMVFANVYTVKHHVLDAVREERFVEMVILDMETSAILDVTAAEMLGELDDILDRRGIVFRLANCTGEVRDMLHATYPKERVGHITAEVTVNHIIDEWIEREENRLDEAEGPGAEDTASE
jgi:high affinity sulfate transporter 1